MTSTDPTPPDGPTVAELVAKHGTLAEFEAACVGAIMEWGVTADEVRAAVSKYRSELAEASRRDARRRKR